MNPFTAHVSSSGLKNVKRKEKKSVFRYRTSCLLKLFKGRNTGVMRRGVTLSDELGACSSEEPRTHAHTHTQSMERNSFAASLSVE